MTTAAKGPVIFPARDLTESELAALCDLEVVVCKEHEAKVAAATAKISEVQFAVIQAKADVQALPRWQELKGTWSTIVKATKEDVAKLGLSVQERMKIGEELAQLESPIREAEDACRDAQEELDSANADLRASLVRSAYLTGQVSGLRLGYRLGYTMAMDYPLSDLIAGFEDHSPATHVAAAMLDDGIAQDIVQDMLETAASDKRGARSGGDQK